MKCSATQNKLWQPHSPCVCACVRQFPPGGRFSDAA